ncbi:MAG TPA: RDD family protein [Acidobacteriota bacterium]|nr:RDD family protein [Acidobacteriota bacterium]
MNCQNCEAVVPPEAERCEKCGAKLLHRRVIFGAQRSGEFVLTAEEEPGAGDLATENDDWQFPTRSEVAASSVAATAQAVAEIRYGGFFRRVGAFMVDLAVILLLCALMGVLAYIGYRVGLAAHGRFLSWDNATPLIFFLTTGCMFLATAYFVVFHGMGGKTIGKCLFGLRVVGIDLEAVSYPRALLRWCGFAGTVGLSCFLILLNRQKRSLHDLLAGTKVIRE